MKGSKDPQNREVTTHILIAHKIINRGFQTTLRLETSIYYGKVSSPLKAVYSFKYNCEV